MYAEKHIVSITTDENGDGVGYTPPVTGRILSIRYIEPDTGGYSAGVDFDVEGETSGIVIWSEDSVDASVTISPRQATHTTAGVAALYGSEGEAVLDYIVLAQERVKITVDDGGNGGTGTFIVIVG